MNGYVLEGRELRVDHAEPEKNNRNNNNNRNVNRRGQPQPPQGPMQQQQPPMPFNLPPGVQLPPGASATDAISQTLTALPADQLLDIMANMKVRITMQLGCDNVTDTPSVHRVSLRPPQLKQGTCSCPTLLCLTPSSKP